METHPSILTCKISWTEEPGGLQSMESQRVSYNWACAHTHTYFFVSWPYWTLTYVIFYTQDYKWPEMILNLRNLREDEWGEKTQKGHHLHNPSLNPAEISSTQGFHTWKIPPHLTVAHSTERFQQKDKVFVCYDYYSDQHMVGIQWVSNNWMRMH